MTAATIFFSASANDGRGAFYHAAIHGAAVPTDAVAISAERYAELLETQSTGRTIAASPMGKPVIAPLRKPTAAELRTRAIAAVKREAGRRILRIATLERQANDNAAIAIAAYSGSGASPELEAALDRRVRIDAVRAASNVLEARLATFAAPSLASFDAAADSLWPAES